MAYKEEQHIEVQYGLKNCDTNKIKWFLRGVDVANYKTNVEQSARILGYNIKFEHVKREVHIKTVKTITYGPTYKVI